MSASPRIRTRAIQWSVWLDGKLVGDVCRARGRFFSLPISRREGWDYQRQFRTLKAAAAALVAHMEGEEP